MAAVQELELGEDQARPDLAERGEVKYCFRSQDVATLRAVLRRVAQPVAHAGPVSHVRSLYFDDERLTACRANLDGVGVRHKLRLRWYDAPAPGPLCFFEIKWRRHLATGKHRFPMRGAAQLLQLPLRRWPAALAAAAPRRFAAFLRSEQQAVALVEYRREHFVWEDARFTLDYDLRFYPLLGRRTYARRFPERLPGFALIECKAPLGDRRLERHALRPLRSRATRFSKYVTGCQRLGYVADI